MPAHPRVHTREEVVFGCFTACPACFVQVELNVRGCAVSRAAALNDEFVAYLRLVYPPVSGECLFSPGAEALDAHCEGYLRLACDIRASFDGDSPAASAPALPDCGFEERCRSYIDHAGPTSATRLATATAAAAGPPPVAPHAAPPAAGSPLLPDPDAQRASRQRWAAALAHLRPRLSSGASAPDSGAGAFSFSLPPSRQPSGRASGPPSRQPSRQPSEAACQPTAAESEAEVPREMCPVCYCEPADFIPSCGHATCSACAIGMLRAACDDQRSALNASGFACVQRCEHRIGPEDVEPLLTDPASSRLRAIRSGAPDPGAQFGGRGGDGALGLSYEEYERFRQFVLEASIPVDERVHCPRCERASARADVTTDGGGGGTRGLRCPHCQHCWRPDATDAQGPSTTATDAYIDATSRRCPSCDVPVTKWHGHSCHHISPQTNGCPNCHQHFCYVCLRKHGRPSPRGRSSEFHNECVHTRTSCHTTRHAHRMRPHISMSPYPHDVRCGCPICPDCRKGMPCELCEGNCVVCHGLVDPGPTQLAQPVAACTVQGCVVHDNRQARRRRREWE